MHKNGTIRADNIEQQMYIQGMQNKGEVLLKMFLGNEHRGKIK